jgi:riboflavin synthase
MFTGIITHSGVFKAYRRGKKEMAVEAPGLAERLAVGDSIAVNGVCLSIIRKENSLLFFNLSQETLGLTNLGSLKPGVKLNLELPLTLSSPLSGHLVTGHVDFKARLRRAAPRKPGKRLVFPLPREFAPYVTPKGSIAVNGVSLTVAALGKAFFEVELIPLTLEKSNLGDLRPGEEANVECDMIGKYVYNWLTHGNLKKSRTIRNVDIS